MTKRPPRPEATAAEGIGLGLGLAAAGAVCWFLPHLMNAGGHWSIAGRIAAWILFTVGAAGSLMELDKATAQPGFSDFGVAAVLIGSGAGLLALARHVLSGSGAAVAAIAGAGLLIVALGGAGMGLGKFAGRRERPGSPTQSGTAAPAAPAFSRAEKWGLALAAMQVALAVVALLAGA